MSERQAYPLSWPEGRPRTAPFDRRRANFGTKGISGGLQRKSMADACAFLTNELKLLKAAKEILSTNVRRRLDGQPYSDRAQPADPGAAVYFELQGKPISLPCDKWDRVEDNVYAIAKHIEALRGQRRWGVGSIEQAFRGYAALPGIGESSASEWWKVLGVPINATEDQVRQAYRILVKKHHPDFGGDAEMFRRLTKAMELFEMQQRQGVRA